MYTLPFPPIYIHSVIIDIFESAWLDSFLFVCFLFFLSLAISFTRFACPWTIFFFVYINENHFKITWMLIYAIGTAWDSILTLIRLCFSTFKNSCFAPWYHKIYTVHALTHTPPRFVCLKCFGYYYLRRFNSCAVFLYRLFVASAVNARDFV